MEKYLQNKKVKLKFEENIEPQEVLLDSLARSKEQEMGVSEKKFEVPISQNYIWIFYTGFLLIIFLFFIRTFDLEINQNKKFLALAKDNKTYSYPIRTMRGVIYDSSGKQLVFNQPSFDLIFDKRNLSVLPEKKIENISAVSKIISVDIKELEKKINESDEQRVLVLENIPLETLLVLEAKISSNELAGFEIEKNYVRDYQDGLNFSHLIGYTGRIDAQEYQSLVGYFPTDYLGKSGVEKSYEDVFRGRPGVFRVEKTALGEEKSEAVEMAATPGKSLVLWLDTDLQKKIEEELTVMFKKIGSQKAAAIAMDPKTGGILALISLPSFDNNLLSKGGDREAINNLLTDPQEPLFDRAIAGTYPSGSTIKPLIASAVLEEKLISPTKEIFDPGYILVENPWDPTNPSKFMDWTSHGLVDLRKAIAVSCNVYFYTVGGGYGDQQGLGPGRIKKYLNLFGWGNKTNIDLPGEKDGLIPDPDWKKNYFTNDFDKIWRDGDTYNLSIGQGYLLVTPLQVVTSFGAIANGGKLLKPQVVKEIISGSIDSPVSREEVKPEVVRENFIDPKNLKIVREGMRDAVWYGSSVILNSLPVSAAAKTGTAQTSKVDYYHNWVTVFAPYDNPEIVLTVVIENVKGAQVAALPVAKGILDWYFTRNSKQ